MSHASSHGGKNAALFLTRLVPQLKPGPAGQTGFIHVSSIECPGSPNTVPDFSVINGQILSFDETESECILAEMKTTAETLARNEGFMVDFEINRDCAPWITAGGDPIIACARDAAAQTGFPFTLDKTCSGSDAQVISQRGGKVIKISADMLNPHSKEECIDLEDMRRCTEYLYALACLTLR
jgi:di/tripeptidase